MTALDSRCADSGTTSRMPAAMSSGSIDTIRPRGASLGRAEEQPLAACPEPSRRGGLDEIVGGVEAGEERTGRPAPSLVEGAGRVAIDQVDLAVVARAALGGDDDPAAVRGHMDHRHDLLAIGRLEDQGVGRLRVAKAMETDAPEILRRLPAARCRAPGTAGSRSRTRRASTRCSRTSRDAARPRDRRPSPRRAPGSPGDRCRPPRAHTPAGGPSGDGAMAVSAVVPSALNSLGSSSTRTSSSSCSEAERGPGPLQNTGAG